MIKYLLVGLLAVLALSTVPTLTPDNFSDFVQKNAMVLVKFFSPNCGHCIKMAPEYKLLHKKSEGKEYKVVEVDCTQHSQLCDQNEVQAYPTIKLYVYGTSFPYEGVRTAAALSAWIGELAKASLTLLDAEQAKAKIGVESFILVSGQSESDQLVIAISRDLGFGGVNHYGLKSSTKFIRYYQAGSTTFQEYTRDQNFPASFIQWAFKTCRPDVLELSYSVLNEATKNRDFPYLLLMVDQGDALARQASEPVRGWCSANRQKILCIHTTKESEAYSSIEHAVQQSQNTLLILSQDLSIGYKYPHDTVTVGNLDQFYLDATADKIERTIDVQREVRERIKYSNVIKLNAKNFNETIAQNDFVFVQFYIPTCGHCVKFAPDYDKVGAHFKGSKVVIAAVDANDEYELAKREGVHSYPTFKAYIRGNSFKYTGKREVNSMIAFNEEVSSAMLLISPKRTPIPLPFVAIGGIDANSYLQALPAFFSSVPIYHITEDNQFTIEYHNENKVRIYKGSPKIEEIVQWLEHVSSSPVLVSMGESVPAKKLEKAIENKLPILVVVNKHERAVAAPALQFLKQYCEEEYKFVCGYVHSDEPDYQDLLEWTGDKDRQANRLYWIKTESLTKYLYPGDPNELTKESLDAFITAAQENALHPYQAAKEETKTSPQIEEL